MENSKFRVIIVGAGPVGLYLAHALSLASIPFIVLEQQSSITNTGGQLIFTWPQTVRLLDQIGLYTEVQEIGVEIYEKKRVFGGDGHVMTSTRFWQDMKDNHAYPFLLLPRGKLVQILYANLPEKESRISRPLEICGQRTGKKAEPGGRNPETLVMGRIVLVGDAAHKTTSVNGLGLTCGLHSAAALANEITKIVVGDREVDTKAIENAFKRYQAEREGEARQIWGDGYKIIRDVTSRRWSSRFWDEWVLPWIDIEKFWGGALVSWLLIRHGQILGFVPFKGEEASGPESFGTVESATTIQASGHNGQKGLNYCPNTTLSNPKPHSVI
ncbi:hypothetical protein EYC84_009312 [Monilinia fructicola]|uniref:FAD-binding domain-containing protein n=1 Tax=Monilinia fructicola TaxID=38448 RepID=A0A5M9JC47_MONFR|nr:hypothetical protein EYC84_009312 [Monilinia fructicola]